nr:uncharacterized protein LOC111997327 [Quercus suber]
MDFAYQDKNPPTKLVAMASVSNAAITGNQDPWLADSGTCDHLIANLNNLTNHSQYKGAEQVTVGNGQALPINNIAPRRTGSWPSKVMSVARLPTGESGQCPKKWKSDDQPILGFSDVDKGSAVEIMYPDLYKGLNLKPGDLAPYSSPLVSFEGRVVTPKGQIRLPIQTGSEVVEVDFIVVDVFSPYTAIVARPWLHTLGAVSFTLHQKVKYPSEGQVCEIRGDQSMARQCLVAAIQHKPEAKSSAKAERSL